MDLSQIEEQIKDAPTVQQEGDIYTLGMFERSLKRLHKPEAYIFEPTQEEIRIATENLNRAYLKKSTLHTPIQTFEGIFQPDIRIGFNFIYYEGNRTAMQRYSQEDLKRVEDQEYVFTTRRIVGSTPLYGIENLVSKFSLWRVGIKSKLQSTTPLPTR